LIAKAKQTQRFDPGKNLRLALAPFARYSTRKEVNNKTDASILQKYFPNVSKYSNRSRFVCAGSDENQWRFHKTERITNR
jgi:hypothetical protein